MARSRSRSPPWQQSLSGDAPDRCHDGLRGDLLAAVARVEQREQRPHRTRLKHRLLLCLRARERAQRGGRQRLRRTARRRRDDKFVLCTS